MKTLTETEMELEARKFLDYENLTSGVTRERILGLVRKAFLEGQLAGIQIAKNIVAKTELIRPEKMIL